MSGAADAFYEVECQLEDAMVLAFNGSSAHLLDHLLTPFEAIPEDVQCVWNSMALGMGSYLSFPVLSVGT